jgi:hypothetical protein
VLIAVFTASICFAQKAPEHAYTIRFSEPISQPQEKFIHEALRNQDPDALVWIDAAEQQVLTRVHAPLDRDQLQADLLPSGAVIFYLGRPVADHPSQKSAEASTEMQLPAFKDTGDPATDNVRYELEKKAWIEAHPAQYDQLTLPE